MPTIIFIQPDGTRQSVQGIEGKTVMEAAVRHNIAGIDAECYGGCSCGTCHVLVPQEWAHRLARRSSNEEATLDYAAGVRDNSRLCCQIVVSQAIDGLVLHLP